MPTNPFEGLFDKAGEPAAQPQKPFQKTGERIRASGFVEPSEIVKTGSDPFEGLFERQEAQQRPVAAAQQGAERRGETISAAPSTKGPTKAALAEAQEAKKPEDTLAKKALRFVLPKQLEEAFGIAPEQVRTGVKEQLQEQESARQSVLRETRQRKTMEAAGVTDEVRQFPDRRIPEGYQEPTGFWGNLKEGAVEGYYSTVRPSLGFIAEGIGQRVGNPKLRAWGEKQADNALAHLLLHPELGPSEDILPLTEGGIADRRAWGRTVGGVIPFITTVVGASTAAGLAGGPGAAAGTAFATIAGIEQANAYRDMLDRGIAPDKAVPASTLYGVIAAALEEAFGFIPSALGVRLSGGNSRAVTESFKGFLGKTLPKYGTTFLKKMAEEAGEEGAQQLAQNLVTKWLDESKPVWEGVAESVAQGAVGSLGFLPVDVISRRAGGGPEAEKAAPKAPTVPPERPEAAEGPVTVSEAATQLREAINEARTATDPAAQDAAEERVGQLYEAFASEADAVKSVAFVAPDAVDGTEAARIEVAKLDDGQFAFSANARLDETTFSLPFSVEQVAPTREAAVEAAKKAIADWAADVRIELSEADKERLRNIEEKLNAGPRPSSAVIDEAQSPLSKMRRAPFTKAEAQKLEAAVQGIREDIKADPERSVAAIIHGRGFTFIDDIETLGEYARREGADDIAAAVGKVLGEDEDAFTATGTAVAETQKEKVKKAVSGKEKSVRQVAEETGILEPNVRRILGVGAKDGTFERVAKGVYVLKKPDGSELAYVQTGDAREVLPEMAKSGRKFDMVFLDIPYETKGVKGGNRGIKFDTISPEQFAKDIVEPVKQMLRTEDSPVVYMFSNSKTGAKEMAQYTKKLIDAGLQVVAKGTYTKTYKGGKEMMFGAYPMPPEGIFVLNKSGKNVSDLPDSFDYRLVAPLYRGHYQTEKSAELLKALIEGTTKVGDTVLDPFAGSGVTPAEAVKAGRKAAAVEKSEEAVEKRIKPRVEKAAKEAERAEPAEETEQEEGVKLGKDGIAKGVPGDIRAIVSARFRPAGPIRVTGGKNLAQASKEHREANFGFTMAQGIDFGGMSDADVASLRDEVTRAFAYVSGHPDDFSTNVWNAANEVIGEVNDEFEERGLDTREPSTAKPGKPVVAAKIEIGDELSYGVIAEMDAAEPGRRIFVDTSEEAGPGYNKVIGIKSTIPGWIPKNLRKTALIREVVAAVNEGRTPEKADEVRLYNATINEIERRRTAQDELFASADIAPETSISDLSDDSLDAFEAALADEEEKVDKELEGYAEEAAEQEGDAGASAPEGEQGEVAPTGSRGGVAASGLAPAGGFYTPPTMGRPATIDSIQAIEVPEMLDIVRELGATVKLKKLRTYAGFFRAPEMAGAGGELAQALGVAAKGDPEIVLQPKLFDDIRAVASTLAHEIGHFVDWLPDGTLKRGTLLKRLAVLRQSFSEISELSDAEKKQHRNRLSRERRELLRGIEEDLGEKIKPSELTKELKDLTQWWKPFDENATTDGYKAYRYSSAEMYADALSVLLNSPGDLQERAPTFFKMFFAYLDRKPEVRDAYFAAQELLSQGREAVVKKRREAVKSMFDKADFKAVELENVRREKDRERRSFRSIWSWFKYETFSTAAPFEDKVRELQAKGQAVTDDENPVFHLNERNYVGSKVKASVEQKFQPVFDELDRYGLTKQDLREMLFYQRIGEGDRGKVANPKGLDPLAVAEMTGDALAEGDTGEVQAEIKENASSLRSELGEEKFAILKDLAQKFRDGIRATFEEGYQEGIYSDELMELVRSNNFYVPFKTQKYMDKATRAAVKQQVGTLSDIEDPVATSIEKVAAIVRAIERNKASRSAVQFLQQQFPAEIEPAKTRWTGKRREIVETDDKDKGTVVYLEKGKPQGFYVDQYIAKSITNDTVAMNQSIVRLLNWMNSRWFKPVFVGINLGFQSFNVIRDFFRFWKNVPEMTMGRAFRLYRRAWHDAVVRGFDGRSDLVTQMEREGILSVTMNDYLQGADADDKQVELVLRRYGLAESKNPLAKNRIGRLLVRAYENVESLGNTLESVPKIAAYLHFKGDEAGPKLDNETRDFIRRFVGSPDFLARGSWTRNLNSVFLFSNAIIQGIRSDYEIARYGAFNDPKNRSGWWWKQAKITFLPKLLMFAGLRGVAGPLVQEIMKEATEYDRTNYVIVPLGKTENKKAAYLRIPQDETSRFLGATFWKSLRYAQTGDIDSLLDIAAIWSGQVPAITPAITVPIDIGKFLSGQNVYDEFRQRTVLTDEEMLAGGKYKLKPALVYVFNQAGGNVFAKLYAGEPTDPLTGAEKVLRFPFLSNVLGRFVKITDYGMKEAGAEVSKEVQGERARRNIEERKVVARYAQEAARKGLGRLGALDMERDLIREVIGHYPLRTPEEAARARSLRTKFRAARTKGIGDYQVDLIVAAKSNEEKSALLMKFKKDMPGDEFKKMVNFLITEKAISAYVVRQISK